MGEFHEGAFSAGEIYKGEFSVGEFSAWKFSGHRIKVFKNCRMQNMFTIWSSVLT